MWDTLAIHVFIISWCKLSKYSNTQTKLYHFKPISVDIIVDMDNPIFLSFYVIIEITPTVPDKHAQFHSVYAPNIARPHVIRCLIHRSKIDCNRDWLEATFGLAGVNTTWYEFHHFTHHARNAATAGGTRRAFYINVHGQVNWNTCSIVQILQKHCLCWFYWDIRGLYVSCEHKHYISIIIFMWSDRSRTARLYMPAKFWSHYPCF